MTKFSEKRFGTDKKTQIIQEAKEHIANFRTLWNENIKMYEEMTRFINGEMWEKDVEASYRSNQRVMLTFNKIRPYIRQIVGEDQGFTAEIRLRNTATDQNTSPQNVQQSEKEKDILVGLVRNIAYHSRTQQIYSEGYIQVLEGGYSAWRVVVIEDGENRALRVRKVDNPLQCYWDLNAKNQSKIDGDYSGLVSYMSKDAFARAYPDIQYPDSFTSADTYKNDWGDKDRIAIGEEYRREIYKQKVYKLQDGTEITDDDLKDKPELEQSIVSSRMEKKSRIVHYKFTDHELLEWSQTPFVDLPLVCSPGYSRIIDGKQRTYSFAYDAKDPQRMLNFIGSDIGQWLKLTKKTKFLVPAKMIDDYVKDWQDPDTPSTALQYDPSVAPGYKPEPLPALPMPADLVEQYSRAEQDIKIALGRYESNIGQTSNEVSGLAIFNRAVQGNSSLSEYRTARNNSIAETGKLILNAIPNIYDSQRKITITDENGEDSEIEINKPEFDLMTGQYIDRQTFEQNKYSIEVDIGDSFPMQRAATAQLCIQLIQADPTGQAFALVSDIIAENIDVDGAQKIAERLKTLVPPAVVAKEQGQPAPQDPNQMIQQQMQQLQLQAAQIKIQSDQMQMMLDKQKASDDHMKALADILNAQTNRFAAESKVGIEEKQVNAEMERTQAEILQMESEEAREHVALHMGLLKDKHELFNNKETI